MHPFSIASLSVFALIPPLITSLDAPPQTSPPQQGTTLKPINIVDFEASVGLQCRGSDDLSVLDPQSHTNLVYGSPDDNGKLLLANMTLYAPDGLPIVLLERFEELNILVKCRDDEGTLSLMFGSMDAFDYARKQWSSINEADGGKFLFIANKDGCGPDDQRQPYIISKITDDTTTLTTSLAAEAVSLSDVAGSYELDFGHAIATQQPQKLQDRGLWGAIENAGQETVNATEGNYNGTKNANFPLNAGQQNQRMNIFADPQAGLTVDCTNCFIAGSLGVTGHFLIQDFSPQELSLTVSPNSVLAALELEAVISASDEPDSQPFTMTLYSGPIYDAGIKIDGILDLGATLVYTVGGNLAFSGSATVDFGVNASLSDTAQIVADYMKNAASSATGFDSYQLTPMFHIDNESASVTLTAFSQPEIVFGIDLTKVGHVDVSVTVQLPELTTTLSADYDEDGACSHDTGASKTGVMVSSEASIEVDLEIDAKLEVGAKDKDDDEKPLFSTQLYTTSMPLPSTCYPLNIPGLVPSANATTEPSLPTVLSIPTAVSGGSAVSTPSLGLGRRSALNTTSLHPLSTSYQSKFGSQINTSFSNARPSSGTLSGLGTTLGVTASPTPSSAKPSSTSPSRGSEFVSSVLAAILGLRPSLDVVSSSVPSLTTSTTLVSDTQTMTATSEGQVVSSTLSNPGKTSIITSATSLKSSSSESPSVMRSTTSTRLGIKSMSALTSSSTFSKVKTSSALSSPTSESSSMRVSSTFTTFPMSSRTESSSMHLSASASSSPKITSSTTLASKLSSTLSSPTSKNSSMTSTLARSSIISRSESGSGSSSKPLSSASSSPKTTSIPTPITSPRSSRIESLSILPSSTLVKSTSKPSQSTKVDSASVKSSESKSSLTLPSTTSSISTHKSSQSTEVDTASRKSSESGLSSTLPSTTSSISTHKPSQNTEVQSTSINSSESKSSFILPSTTSSISTHKPSQSIEIDIRPFKSPESKSPTIQSSTTQSLGATKPLQSTKVASASAKPSESESSSIQSSISLSLSTKSSQSPTVDTATRSTSLTPSKSASKGGPSDASPLTSTTASSSLLPDSTSQTTVKQPSTTPIPLKPSNTKSQSSPSPKSDESSPSKHAQETDTPSVSNHGSSGKSGTSENSEKSGKSGPPSR